MPGDTAAAGLTRVIAGGSTPAALRIPPDLVTIAGHKPVLEKLI